MYEEYMSPKWFYLIYFSLFIFIWPRYGRNTSRGTKVILIAYVHG